jgi:hypothetical protein
MRLAAEAEMCERLATACLRKEILAPLYRLPEAAFSTSFPALLAEAVMGRLEVRQLTEFRGAVQEINSGLERIAEAQAAGDMKALTGEADRVTLKCQNLLEGRDTTLPRVAFIRELLERHAPRLPPQ